MTSRRTKGKLIRMTPEEFAEIERRARAAGYLPARYVRQAALDGRSPSDGRGTAGQHRLRTRRDRCRPKDVAARGAR
jgi:hypothetical protein